MPSKKDTLCSASALSSISHRRCNPQPDAQPNIQKFSTAAGCVKLVAHMINLLLSNGYIQHE